MGTARIGTGSNPYTIEAEICDFAEHLLKGEISKKDTEYADFHRSDQLQSGSQFGLVRFASTHGCRRAFNAVLSSHAANPFSTRLTAIYG